MSKNKRLTDMSAVAGTFRFDGVLYERDALPPHVKDYLATIGLKAAVAQTKEPAKLYADLKTGTIKEPKSDEPQYGEWHMAAASVHAMSSVAASGVKVKGEKLRATPEYEKAYEDALAAMSPWNREKTAEARKHPEVLAEYHRITGSTPAALNSLFGAPDASEDVQVESDSGSQEISEAA